MVPIRPKLAAASLVALALVAFGAPASAADEDEAFLTQISIGRLSALVYSATDILDSRPGERPGGAESEVIEPAGLYRSLYRTWLEMETLRGRGCGEGLLNGEVCASRFEPEWLRPPGSFTPTLAEVTAWADALQSEVMIVTMPICAIPPLDPDGPGACSVE